MIYELSTIPSADDYPALQAGIDQAIAAGYLEIHISHPSGGTYNLSRGLLFCNPNGNFLNGIHFYGDGGCDGPYTLNITNPAAYGVHFLRAKGCICENIRLEGMNKGLLNYTQQQVLSGDSSTFLTNGVVDSEIIPHAGFVTDGLGYAEVSAYTPTSTGGSTDVIFRNCVARYFTVDYALSPGGALQNGEAIKIVDCWGDYAKVAISTGGSQQRSVYVENFKCWGIVETVFDCRRYGPMGCPPEVIGANIAGGNRYLCRLNSWISKGLTVSNTHMERLWSLGGNFDTYVNQISIRDSWIDLVGNTPGFTRAPSVFQGAKLILSNTFLWHYSDQDPSPVNVMVTNIDFEDVVMDAIPVNNYPGIVPSYRNCQAGGKYFGDDLRVMNGISAAQEHTTNFLWYGKMSIKYDNGIVRTRKESVRQSEILIPELILGDITAGSATITNVNVEGGYDFLVGVEVFMPHFPDGTTIVSYTTGTTPASVSAILMSAPAIYSEKNAAILSGDWTGELTGYPDVNSGYRWGFKIGDIVWNNRFDLYPEVIGWQCTESGITGTERIPQFKAIK